jgi:hypothetical protein
MPNELKPLGMSQEELSRTEFWRALTPGDKRILVDYFSVPERTLAEAVAIYQNRTSMTRPVVDDRAMRIAEKLLQDPNVQAVIELWNGKHISQKEVL